MYDMSMENNCIQNCRVCQKHRGEIVIPGGAIYENDLIFISHALPYGEEKEHYLGHIFIESKRHIPELADLHEEEARQIGLFSMRISRALMDCLGMEHVYSFVIGDGVAHVHIHLIGRYPGAPREFWGVHVDEWQQAPKGGPQEIQRITEQLRDYLVLNNWY